MNAYDRLVRLSLGKDFSVFEPITIRFNQLPSLMCQANILYSPSQYKDNRRKRKFIWCNISDPNKKYREDILYETEYHREYKDSYIS